MTQANQNQIAGIKLPKRFIEDCYDCDVDVGKYRGGKLYATAEQLADLKSRAALYADGVDMAPLGIVLSARATLAALKSAGV